MLKNILKLQGAQKLTKNEQKSINGGGSILYQQMCSRCDDFESHSPACIPWNCPTEAKVFTGEFLQP
ncbi:hypothetical protein HNQ02_002684 [Flavobacterium sp. 7E]|uniref:hypothetical protein n=1 Tax=Flavobacterium sp. 7E TaxID=2735898 RepID=UPI00156DA28F|nr:hypothetical protein [Flavobacterium sp. 7E]NRS89752.1 hypothetical protein [Flavobacterium sp. 7E]